MSTHRKNHQDDLDRLAELQQLRDDVVIDTAYHLEEIDDEQTELQRRISRRNTVKQTLTQALAVPQLAPAPVQPAQAQPSPATPAPAVATPAPAQPVQAVPAQVVVVSQTPDPTQQAGYAAPAQTPNPQQQAQPAVAPAGATQVNPQVTPTNDLATKAKAFWAKIK